MNLAEFARLDGTALAELVRDRETSADEIQAVARQAAERVNPAINAVIEVFDEPRRAQAAAVDEVAFSGVPFLIKDVGATLAGVRAENGSRLCQGMVAECDSEVLLRFLRAGTQAIGRSAASEFGMLTTTETALFGATATPWDPARSAAGSSGGAAAAVAAGVVPIAHGGDAGGSIRLPASYCGVVGLKPSRGRVSRQPQGSAALDWAVDFALTRSIRDAAGLLDATAGPALGDPYVIPGPNEPFAAALTREIGSLRAAICTQPWSGVPALEELSDAVHAVATVLAGDGVSVEEAAPQFSWEQFVEAQIGVFAPVFAAEIDLISRQTGRQPGPETLEPHCLAVLREGRRRGLDGFLAAQEQSGVVARDIARFFKCYDLLITPTIPTLPEPLATYRGREDDGPSEIAALWELHGTYTDAFNLCGVPAMSLPLAWSRDELPIGIQLVAGFGAEETLLRCAAHLERAMPWAHRQPPVHVSATDDFLRQAQRTRERASNAHPG